MRILFTINDLSIIGKPTLNTRIKVSKVSQNGDNGGGDAQKEEVEHTEVVYESLSPSWPTPVIIDYSMRDTADYVAELFSVEEELGAEKLLAEVSFKLAELVTSKGEFIFKELNVHGVIQPMDDEADGQCDEHGNSKKPIIGLMGIEEKEGDRDALEFNLNVHNLPKKLDTASFFQVHRQVQGEEFELVYESKYQNPVARTLNFDEASILLSKMQTVSPNLSCRLEVFTCAKKSIFDRMSAKHLGTVTFTLSQIVQNDD